VKRVESRSRSHPRLARATGRPVRFVSPLAELQAAYSSHFRVERCRSFRPEPHQRLRHKAHYSLAQCDINGAHDTQAPSQPCFCTVSLARPFSMLALPEKWFRRRSPNFGGRKFVYIVVSRANFTTDLWEPQLSASKSPPKAQQVMAAGVRGISFAAILPGWHHDGLSRDRRWKSPGSRHAAWRRTVKRVTKAATGVQHFRWRPDGKAFAYAALDDDAKKRARSVLTGSFEVQNNDYLRQSAPKSSHLWLAVIDGENRRITSGTWTMPIAYPPGPAPSPITWTPDGNPWSLCSWLGLFRRFRSGIHADGRHGDRNNASRDRTDATANRSLKFHRMAPGSPTVSA